MSKLSALLTIVFVVLKLVHCIAWGWVWVFAPLWIYWGLRIAIKLAVFCFIFVVAFTKRIFS